MKVGKRAIFTFAILHQACAGAGGCDSDLDFGQPWDFDVACPDVTQSGPTHGVNRDGRIDITALEAWPDRADERPPPSAATVAEACAAFAACADDDPEIRSAIGPVEPIWLATCLGGSLNFFGVDTEERAIPLDGYDERWSFFIGEVAAAHGDCAAIRSVLTRSARALECQEDGCWTDAPSAVTCEGDVASFENASTGSTATRDCSRAYAHCSTSSPTGCTDRAPLACDPDGMDRCDGDIKLGCDECGFVTFHDCARNLARCVETDDGNGAKCVPLAGGSACKDIPLGCEGQSFSACVWGERVQVNCDALGMDCRPGTTPSTTGADASDQPAINWAAAHCVARKLDGGVDGG